MRKPRPHRPVTTPDTRRPRINVNGTVQVEMGLAGDFPEITGWVKNLNHLGMSMWCKQRLPEEAEVEFRLNFVDDNVALNGRGWVVFANENGMAVQFDDFEPDRKKALSHLLERFQPFPAF